jgi:hypothetical protein
MTSMTTVSPVGVLPTALAGLNRASAKAEQAADRIASGAIDAKDIVELKLAEVAFKANAKVIRSAAETERRLLDVLA